VLTDALSSRFALQVRVSTDYDLAKQLKIDRRAVRARRTLPPAPSAARSVGHPNSAS
jgi:hypothetical protein